MSVYQRKDKYYIDYYIGQKRVRECVGKIPKREAEKLLSARLTQIIENKIYDKRTVFTGTVAELVDTYIARKRQEDGDDLADGAKFLTASFCARFGTFAALDINTPFIELWRDCRVKEVKKSTVNREMTIMSAAFNCLIRRGELTYNPFNGVARYSETEYQRKRVLTYPEWIKLREACPEKHLPILELAYNTAMRRGEILNLTWDRVDTGEGFIALRAEDTKTRQERIVPITSKFALEWLRLHQKPEGRVFDVICFKKRFKKICKDAEVSNFNFHDFRHTAITNMLRSGMSVPLIMKITGHRSLNTLIVYLNVLKSELKAEMEKVVTNQSLLTSPEAQVVETND